MVLLDWPPPDHLWIGRRSRQFAPSQRLTNVPELRTPNAAAQTRTVSGGAFWPSRGELSRHFKYMPRARISEFESSQASHAVPVPMAMSGLQKYAPKRRCRESRGWLERTGSACKALDGG